MWYQRENGSLGDRLRLVRARNIGEEDAVAVVIAIAKLMEAMKPIDKVSSTEIIEPLPKHHGESSVIFDEDKDQDEES